MNVIKMNEFGSTLTDREDGKKAFREISGRSTFPVALDFSDVVSLGSSFGEEVILKIASLQGGGIAILNVNHVIKISITRIIEDTSIRVSFTDSSEGGKSRQGIV